MSKSKHEKKYPKKLFNRDKKNKPDQVNLAQEPKKEKEDETQQNFQRIMLQINEMLESIESVKNELKTCYENYFDVIGKEKKRLTTELNALITRIYTQADQLLEKFKEAKLCLNKSTLDNTTIERFSALCQKRYNEFQQSWSDFYASKVKFENNIKQMNKINIAIVYPDATKEQLEEIELSDPSLINKISKIGSKQTTAESALDYLISREKELSEISLKLKEVEKLFIDLAILTKKQEKTVNAINNNVSNAKQLVNEGTQSLKF